MERNKVNIVKGFLNILILPDRTQGIQLRISIYFHFNILDGDFFYSMVTGQIRPEKTRLLFTLVIFDQKEQLKSMINNRIYRIKNL